MEDSVFTKIIKGELPCHKVYEDQMTIAFLNIHPTHPGHTLVVPKIQVDQYIDLPDDYYMALWKSVKIVAAQLRQKIGKQRVGVLIEGVDVPHVHVHLIPFNKEEGLKTDRSVSDNQEPNHQSLKKIADQVSLI